MENPYSHRIKHDLLGIDATIRSSRPLSERDVFDVLKKQDPDLPGRLLKKYHIQRDREIPDQELLGRYETAGLKAMENGFFETEGSFTEGVTEGVGMIARGARRVPISMNLSDNLRAISDDDLGGDPMKYAGDQWSEAVEKSAQQLYGLSQTDRALELGLPMPIRYLDPVAKAGRYFSDFDKNMDKALSFGGLPKDASAKRIVMNRVLELDERKSQATTGQAAMEAWAGLALLGHAGDKLRKFWGWTPTKAKELVKGLSEGMGEFAKAGEAFDRRAELDYLANQDHIIRGMEEGAQMAAQIGKASWGGVLEPAFGGAETLTDIKTGAVQPDRDQAMAMSLIMSPDVPLTMGASGALSVIRNSVSRGMIIGLGRKATLENSAKTALTQFKSIPKPNAVQKQLIARSEKVLRENAGAQQKLNQVVNKNKAIGHKVGIEEGVTRGGNYTQLGQRVQEALARTTGPEASITRRVTGKALGKAGITTETLGKAIEVAHRVPEEAMVNWMTKTGGMELEKAQDIARKISFRGRALLAGGFAVSNLDMDIDVIDAVSLMLLTPGGYKLLTRAGSDMAILGRQLQYAKASSPLFQRLAQMEPATPGLSEVTIDRTSALTVPMSEVAGQVMSSGRNFGISPMLKGPSAFLTRTGFGNTLESVASTTKTATYASAFPLAFGYAVGGEEGAGMGLGASLFPLTIGMGVGHFAQVNSKFDLIQKLAGDEVIYKDSLDVTQKPIFESMPKQVRQAIATGQMQNPDVMIDFRKGRGNSSYQVVDGESQITIYEKSSPAEIMQAVMGHEIAHHIDKFGYSTLIQEQLLGSVEKNKPGIFTEFDTDGKPIIITDPDGTKSYKTNKEFSATHEDVKSGRAEKIGHRQVYLDKLEASGYGPGTREYASYKENNSEIAREIFASHGAAEFFGGKFVKANYEGAGSKLVRSLARPIFNSNGMRNFFHRIGLASNERGLVADPTKLMPGLKEIPELTDMIRKYNSGMRGLDSEGRRAWAQRSGNLVDKDFADEFASAKLTAKDLENPAIVERLKAGGHVKIKDDGSLDTDASGRPVFLPTREVNKRNKNLSNDILDILRKKQGQLKEGHVEIETTATGAERASGGFLGADIIAALKNLNRYNPHQLDALGAISRSIEAGGGDAWDLFYYSALKWNKAGRKVYGQIKGGDRLSIPFGIEISKDGNILIQTISVDQFRNNLKYFATSNKFKQKMAQAFNASNETEATLAAFRALPLYLENQRNNIPNDGTNGVTVAQRDFINAALGSVNQEQVLKNPILDAMGKNKRNRSVAIRSRRLDRIGQATQSPRSFGQYDPNKVSQNLMPQMEMDFSPPKPTQSPEAKPNFWKIYRINPKGPKVYDQVADVLIQVGSPWMDGSIAESQAGLLRLDQNKLLQAMNRAHRRSDRGGGKQFMPAAYHGTPHTFKAEEGAPLGKFKSAQIGTGEGAQAYGHGLYFAGRKEVGEHYRKTLTNKYSKYKNEPSDFKKSISKDLIREYEKAYQSAKEAGDRKDIVREKLMSFPVGYAKDRTSVQIKLSKEIKRLNETLNRTEEEMHQAIRKMHKDIGESDYMSLLRDDRGSLYKVELAPKENEYLLWDKPLSEQPKGVREKMKKLLTELEGEDLWKHRKDQDYRDITNNALEHMSEPEISRRMKEAGIPGIKYLDGSSRSKGKGDYNYVLFDEADVTITEKQFMPASEAGAPKGRVAEAAKRLKDLELSAKKDPLDSPSRNHLIQASLLEGIINESQGGAELDIRVGKHEGGEGSTYVEYIGEGGDAFKIRATDHDRQLSSITNHRRPDFTLASNKKNVSESSGDWIDAVVKLENETDFRIPKRLEDRIKSIISRREEIQKLNQEIATQERLQREQASKAIEDAKLKALKTSEGKTLSDEIDAIRLELQNSSGTGKYTRNQRQSMYKRVRKLEKQLEGLGRGEVNFMPASEAGAPKGKVAEAAKLWNEKGAESPYFKKWFGKSKVVDENGEPLGVYHGTDKEFTAFDPDKLGGKTEAHSAKQAFFASSSVDVAESYIYGDSGGLGLFEKSEMPKVLEKGRKLSSQLAEVLKGEAKINDQIKTAESSGDILDLSDYLPDLFSRISDNEMSMLGSSGDTVHNVMQGEFTPINTVDQLWQIQTDLAAQMNKWSKIIEGGRLMELILKIENPYDVKWDGKGTISEIIAEAKVGGHDGGIIRGIEDAWNVDGIYEMQQPADHYFFFNSDQAAVRSSTRVRAIGNRGTFDAGEGNINYMPSDPKAPKAQPGNRLQPQAQSMPANRFMAPASAAKGELSELFR